MEGEAFRGWPARRPDDEHVQTGGTNEGYKQGVMRTKGATRRNKQRTVGGAKSAIVRFEGEPQDVVDGDLDNREMKNLQA